MALIVYAIIDIEEDKIEKLQAYINSCKDEVIFQYAFHQGEHYIYQQNRYCCEKMSHRELRWFMLQLKRCRKFNTFKLKKYGWYPLDKIDDEIMDPHPDQMTWLFTTLKYAFPTLRILFNFVRAYDTGNNYIAINSVNENGIKYLLRNGMMYRPRKGIARFRDWKHADILRALREQLNRLNIM